MDHREKLLKIVQDEGPLLPSQINKELNTNVLFASAMLSEMVDTKKLKLTHLKIGGSPLYYCPGQEQKLEGYSGKLNEKDQRTFELLKQEKVLRDKDQEPLTRVSLREIKDFAIPLQVTIKDKKELFWKYYLLPDKEAEKIIKDYLEKNNYLEPKKAEIEVKEEVEKTEIKKEETKESQTRITDAVKDKRERMKNDENEREEIVKENKDDEEIERKTETEEREKKEKEIIEEKRQEKIEEIPGEKREEKIEERKEAGPGRLETENIESLEKGPDLEEQKITREEPELKYSYSFSFSAEKEREEEKKEKEPGQEERKKEERKEPEYPEDDEFFNNIKSYFEKNQIKIKGFELIRKGSEYDFVVMLPSPVGELEYYCKARSKKKINDGDVSSAYVTGQMKQMPILLLTEGDLTNKAKEMMQGFKSFVHKEIDKNTD